MPDIEKTRARLAAVDRELAALGARYDLAMSAFKFDEARKVQQQITALERERAQLSASAPQPQPSAGPIPVMIRPRRPGPRRR
jgi:hypothetical protein